jgi:hypothetical protein
MRLGRVGHRLSARHRLAWHPRHRKVRPHLDLVRRVFDDRNARQFAQP